jgi:hypothetical protein
MIKFRYFLLFFTLIAGKSLFCSRTEVSYNLPEIKLEVVSGETCFFKFVVLGRQWQRSSRYEKLERLLVDEDFDRKFKVWSDTAKALNLAGMPS